jgi:hypothetical protein
MNFTIEFFRIRPSDEAHATLDRILVVADNLDAATVKAKSLFDTLDMPQKPDGLRILDQVKRELFVWKPDDHDALMIKRREARDRCRGRWGTFGEENRVPIHARTRAFLESVAKCQILVIYQEPRSPSAARRVARHINPTHYSRPSITRISSSESPKW